MGCTQALVDEGNSPAAVQRAQRQGRASFVFQVLQLPCCASTLDSGTSSPAEPCWAAATAGTQRRPAGVLVDRLSSPPPPPGALVWRWASTQPCWLGW